MLHHVEIYVSDLARSREFWSLLLEELGCARFQEWPQGFSYKQGATYLVFVQTEPRFLEPGFHRRRTGLNHLAFHAGSRAAVDELTRKLQKIGAPLLYEERHPFAGGPEHYAAFLEDPDRLKVELVAAK